MNKSPFIFLCFIFISCSSIQKAAIDSYMEDIEMKFNHHSALVLYDLEKQEIVYDHNGNKFFTPASNTKILTFYTSLKILGDSLITFSFKQKGDSLILWPAGDPTFLNPEFPKSTVAERIASISDNIIVSFSHSDIDPFGPGWAWDDYPYTFSAERGALPMYGNYFKISEGDTSLVISVPYFKENLWLGDSATQAKFTRDPGSNKVIYYPGKEKSSDTVKIPYKVDPVLSTQLLADTLHQSIYLSNIPIDTNARLIKSMPVDTAYKKLMQESNNFVAEQLLLQCSFVLFDSLNTEKAIKYSLDNFLSDLPQKPVWVDGSGLSRHNLVTPMSMIVVLRKLYEEFGRERIFPLMAAGGESGTIKNYYKNKPPYIYAKTGTLSNNHNLSGYLITQKGKFFIFSFMNNNYPTSSFMVKKNMEEILWEIHLNN